jgi:hypothetical protein
MSLKERIKRPFNTFASITVGAICGNDFANIINSSLPSSTPAPNVSSIFAATAGIITGITVYNYMKKGLDFAAMQAEGYELVKKNDNKPG